MPPALQQATANPHLCQRLLDTHGQVRVSHLWGHGSFLLGPGVHRFLFVPSRSLLSQSCVSSGGSVMGLMATSSKRVYATPRSAALVPPQETNTPRQVWRSLYGVCWCAQGLFEPSKHLWRVWGLILNVILHLLPSCWGFSFAFGRGVSFFGGIQHSPFDGCSAASCILEFSEKLSTCPSTLPFCHFGLKIY